ncbi:hypothetical protein OROMI_018350 [Orobanche minor]
MGCFKLPEYLLNEIESIIAKFWWGNGNDKKIHWVKWYRLCASSDGEVQAWLRKKIPNIRDIERRSLGSI